LDQSSPSSWNLRPSWTRPRSISIGVANTSTPPRLLGSLILRLLGSCRRFYLLTIVLNKKQSVDTRKEKKCSSPLSCIVLFSQTERSWDRHRLPGFPSWPRSSSTPKGWADIGDWFLYNYMGTT
jgi:hypothetical protein